ncbi:hypothetical protein TSUD_267840 [Trifolium subterraneum]|uniref:NAC domain-containing protein n=1 Tax=Trifolium subterraneum TaxID=3900 RepID=A0A2Z6PG83_TRISU|nr:hypothetical protein TSUD_267840 [Trifolium subterraneum]
MNNISSTNPRSFMQRENQYLLHQQQHQNHPRNLSGFELEKPELGLHYQHLQNSQYSLFHSQTQPQPLQVNFDYSYASSLQSEQPITVKQLMTNPRDCESGSDGLRYQVSESGIEVGSCEPPQEMGVGRSEGMNEWGMLDRLVNEDSTKEATRFEDANPHQINQLSLRGEMDFWGYGKQ